MDTPANFNCNSIEVAKIEMTLQIREELAFIYAPLHANFSLGKKYISYQIKYGQSWSM